MGAFASLYGVDVYRSPNCALINCGADRQGVMMPVGNQSGLAYTLKVGEETEFKRNASLRATEIEIPITYGRGCINFEASGGVAIITKSSGDDQEAGNTSEIARLMEERGYTPLAADNKGGIGFKEGE
jgi:hypothetical protein